VGGLIGFNATSTVTECVAEGNVVATGVVKVDVGGDVAGGLIGLNTSDVTHPISQCYARGSVSGRLEIGGLIGTEGNAGGGQGDPDVYGHVIQCYATGHVSAAGDVGGLIGKIAGLDTLSLVTESFWDTQTTGIATSHGGGAGLTTAQMKTQSTFTSAAWDFVSTWGIAEGASYPFLLWLTTK